MIRKKNGEEGIIVRAEKLEIESARFLEGLLLYVLYARRSSVDSRVLLDPHSRYSGSATVPPRRYSDSKMLTPRRDSSNDQIRKEKRAHYDGSNSARMLLDRGNDYGYIAR